MILERITSAGIANNSYLVGSGNDAAVIDPRRDCQVYLDLVREKDLRIKHIFETHRNEDYVHGSVELSKLTGAEIYHGPGLDWRFGKTLADGQDFKLGSVVLKALHTPGHTDESVSYTVEPARGGTMLVVFSGDALFAGDVGRTDLYGPAEVERLASNLYDSIFNRILPLGDGVILCPAHGAGSVCGTRIADRPDTTMGIEKALNPMLKISDKSEFVARKVAEKPERPPYFTQMEKYNLEGPPLLGNVVLPQALSLNEFRAQMEAGAVVVDTRDPAAFGGAHVKGSYSIGVEWLPGFSGWFLAYDQPILLILEDAVHLDRAWRYLVRLGYDRVAGYLRGGIESWYNAALPIETLPTLSVHQLKKMIDDGEDVVVLDVRGDDEWRDGHLGGAQHIYVGEIEPRVGEVSRDKPAATFCNVGRRAGIAASVLLRKGYPRVFNVLGSWQAWKAAGFPVTKE
ncbi:MAG: MBL fold metallo-hydrolase [Chloroflexi bacterium RBG_16_57_8]|nr:MAG: MBL fold metallo-hydrolase [Chloroflexi bacterium RBG_16_57_8]